MDYRIWMQILMELAIAVSGEQDLKKLLKKSTHSFLRKMDCTFVGIYQWHEDDLTQVMMAPLMHNKKAEIQFALSDFKGRIIKKGLEHFSLSNDEGYFYGYSLKGFGLLILHRRFAIDPELNHELLPIINMLSQNIRGCLEFQRRESLEATLNQERQFLKALIDTIPDLVFYKDEFGVYQLVNRQVASILNKKTDDFVGLTDFDIHDFDEAHHFHLRDMQIMASGASTTEEIVYTHYDGLRVPYETSLTPFIGLSGKTRGVIGISRDISRRKELDQLLENRFVFQKVLTDLAKQFINVPPQQVDEAINAALRAAGEYTKVDRSYVFTYDFDLGLMSNTHEWCKSGIESYKSELQSVPTEMFRTGWIERHEMGLNVIVPDVDALDRSDALYKILDGQDIKSLITLPMSYGSKLKGFIGFDTVQMHKEWLEDDMVLLSVLAELIMNALVKRDKEVALVEARRLAEAASDAKTSFLANMSHEIRTPLNGIVGMLYLLEDTIMNTEQIEYLSIIKESVNSLLEIINNILDYSKIESGEFKLNSDVFSLEECIYSVTSMLSAKSSEKFLEIIVDYKAHVPHRFVGDSMRIKQILINLVGNAIKFTDQGHILITVDILEETQSGTKLSVAVEDTGIGIPRDKQDAIFLKFTQEDDSSSKKYGGTGLGLAIARELTELMGGQLILKSQVGNGSCFTFTLVMQPVIDSDEPVELGESLIGRRVLIVDDNLINRKILEAYLESWQIKYVSAKNGKEALEKLELSDLNHDKFDFLLVDLAMPEMDGLTFGRHVRENLRYRNTHLILISSIVGSIRKSSLMASGYEVMLPKPFPKRDLKITMCKLLKGEALMLSATGLHQSSTSQLISSSIGSKKGKLVSILLVDDHDINRKAASLILSKKGYEVIEAKSGQEALEICTHEYVDLILMDIQMPEMDGYQTVRSIRALKGHNLDVPIIALTANAMAQDRQKSLDAGMNGHIAKPFKIEELNSLIEKLITTERVRIHFDETAFIKRYDDDVLLAKEILDAFFKQLTTEIKVLNTLVARQDYENFNKHLHDLKGTSSYVSACEIEKSCAYMEMLVKNGDINELGIEVTNLEQLVNMFEAQAKNWINLQG
jgi:PAS domain S-box-containing protein